MVPAEDGGAQEPQPLRQGRQEDHAGSDKVAMTFPLLTRVILPGEKALIVNRLNIKIIYVPYTNKQKSQIGEFGSLWAFTSQPPVAVA